MASSKYSEEEQKRAMRLYVADGPAVAAEKTGIPVGTIKSWASRGQATEMRKAHAREAVEAARLTWQQRRAEQVLRLGEVAAAQLEKVDQAHSGRDARSYAQAYGVLFDKVQLLTGGATERHDLTGEEARETIRRLREQIEAGREQDELAAKRAAKAV